MRFPLIRMRRLRNKPVLRRMLTETRLCVDQLIMPLFVTEGQNIKKPVPSMPGVSQLSLDQLIKKIEEIVKLNIPAVLLFGIPAKKDKLGSQAYAPKGIIQRAIGAIKKHFPDLIVITDVCMCEYTSHGHCGVIKDGVVDNDQTVKLLAQIAVSHAQAGADIVAPSDMMDGRITAIRTALDKNGFQDTLILSYAAKYASSFYSPFREAAQSTPSFGDRKGYQMAPPNWREALREIELDIQEGADIIMVKPALAYLDIITKVKERFNYPLAAYNVSGEYAMVKAAALNGWLSEKEIVLEILTAIKRAGADLIITYWACEVAQWLRDQCKVI